jgi:hypothetical protein
MFSRAAAAGGKIRIGIGEERRANRRKAGQRQQKKGQESPQSLS